MNFERFKAMSKKHNWAPAPNSNPDSYVGFVSLQEGCEIIGKVLQRKENTEGKAHYAILLEEPCQTVFTQEKNGNICTVPENSVVGVSEIPSLRGLEQVIGKVVRIRHISTDVRDGETRARIHLSVEVAQD